MLLQTIGLPLTIDKQVGVIGKDHSQPAVQLFQDDPPHLVDENIGRCSAFDVVTRHTVMSGNQPMS